MTIHLSKRSIDLIFETATSSEDYIKRLFKLLIPRFDQATSVIGWPLANDKTIGYLYQKAKEYDMEHSKNTMPGQHLINAGFSVSNKIKDDFVFDTSKIKVMYSNEDENKPLSEREWNEYNLLHNYFKGISKGQNITFNDEYKYYLSLRARTNNR